VDIIALSLGLAPVPPTPSQMRREAIRDKHRAAALKNIAKRRAVSEITDALLQLMRKRDHVTFEDAMAELDISRAMASSQLAMLLEAGLVTRTRELGTDGKRAHAWRIADDDDAEPA